MNGMIEIWNKRSQLCIFKAKIVDIMFVGPCIQSFMAVVLMLFIICRLVSYSPLSSALSFSKLFANSLAKRTICNFSNLHTHNFLMVYHNPNRIIHFRVKSSVEFKRKFLRMHANPTVDLI